jgi:hypothetical protein
MSTTILEPDLTIRIVSETLSDGSKVFNVNINGAVLECITEKDAYALAETMKAAVEKHTNSTAEIDDWNAFPQTGGWVR